MELRKSPIFIIPSSSKACRSPWVLLGCFCLKQCQYSALVCVCSHHCTNKPLWNCCRQHDHPESWAVLFFPKGESFHVFEDYLINYMHTVKSVFGKMLKVCLERKNNAVPDSAKEWLCWVWACLGMSCLPSGNGSGIQCSQQYDAVLLKIWDVLGLRNS